MLESLVFIMPSFRTITNADTFREKIRGKFAEVLNNPDMATNLEKGIYNYSIKESTNRKIIKKWENPYFVQIYLDRLRAVYLNLKNDDLLKQMRDKELTPQTLAFMTHQEMNPEHWKDMIERKIKRDANKYNANIQASTDMFTCKKCKSKRCTYYELQTRSADEPATIFVTCLDCGKHSKS